MSKPSKERGDASCQILTSGNRSSEAAPTSKPESAAIEAAEGNEADPEQQIMRKLASLSIQLKRLRERHNEQTTKGKWLEAQTTRNKIIALLNQVHEHFPMWRETDPTEPDPNVQSGV